MPPSSIVQLTTDQIGDLGELLAALALSRPVVGRFKRPLFRPTHLGGKYPAADFVVDVLADDNQSLGFFFVQVKSTHKRGGAKRRRLPISMDRDKMRKLARLPAPTFIVGVDLQTEQTYIVSAFTLRYRRPYSISMGHSLADDKTRVQLYREVVAYWSRRKRRAGEIGFEDD